MVWYIIFINLVDLGNFVLKFILFIPADHLILKFRVVMWGFCAITSTREYYDYMKRSKPLGMQVWLCHMILFAEWICVWRHSEGVFLNTTPMLVQVAWSVLALAIGLAYFVIKK
jgi:hypothetical protein